MFLHSYPSVHRHTLYISVYNRLHVEGTVVACSVSILWDICPAGLIPFQQTLRNHSTICPPSFTPASIQSRSWQPRYPSQGTEQYQSQIQQHVVSQVGEGIGVWWVRLKGDWGSAHLGSVLTLGQERISLFREGTEHKMVGPGVREGIF